MLYFPLAWLVYKLVVCSISEVWVFSHHKDCNDVVRLALAHNTHMHMLVKGQNIRACVNSYIIITTITSNIRACVNSYIIITTITSKWTLATKWGILHQYGKKKFFQPYINECG